jgi:hypothetical protein
MTTNPAPSGTLAPDAPRRGLSTVAKILLFVGLPILIILIAVGLSLAFWVRPVSFHATASASDSSTIAVSAPNAGIRVTPSTDDRVHVEATGWHSGPRPTLTVDTQGDTTTIQGRCGSAWLSFCYLEITISAPSSADLTVESTNGAIGVSGLAGSVRVQTTNGTIDTRNLGGTLDLQTTNGAIRASACESDDVTARTTNGAVDLHFTRAPGTVKAGSTNGSITVSVPSDESYFIDAHTVNGRVDTNDIGSDRKADRTITAETVNGAITVRPE